MRKDLVTWYCPLQQVSSTSSTSNESFPVPLHLNTMVTSLRSKVVNLITIFNSVTLHLITVRYVVWRRIWGVVIWCSIPIRSLSSWHGRASRPGVAGSRAAWHFPNMNFSEFLIFLWPWVDLNSSCQWLASGNHLCTCLCRAREF